MRRFGHRTEIPKELKDKYFFIDYLRLHRFGKENQIWKKNRNMLVKEHEYSRDSMTVARKGYRSYIQRCLKSILDWMYPDFEIIKPRNRFAYEIGKRYDNRNGIIPLKDAEDKIKYVLQRYLMNGSFADVVVPYRDSVMNASCLSFKNNESGIKITLDPERSFAYEAVRHLQNLRKYQDEIIEKVDDGEIFKDMLIRGLARSQKRAQGDRVQFRDFGNGILTDHFGTILRERTRTDGYRGLELSYEIERDITGANETLSFDYISPILGEASAQREVPESVTETTSPLMDRVVEYALENYANSTGIDAGMIFTLARGAVVREFTSQGDHHSATELRRLQPTAAILDQIGGTHTIESEDEYEEEEEWCEECGETIDNCYCCGECLMADCQCEELEEIA